MSMLDPRRVSGRSLMLTLAAASVLPARGQARTPIAHPAMLVGARRLEGRTIDGVAKGN